MDDFYCNKSEITGDMITGITYHDVFGEEIVAEGAVVKVHLIEGLFGELHHVTLVVAAVLVLTDHLLSYSQLMHGGFIALLEEIQGNRYQCISSSCPDLKEEVTRSSAAPYLDLSGTFVSTAGDMHHKGPFIWLHENSSGLGTCGVVGSGTAAVRALHAAARCFLHPLLTVVTFLPGKMKNHQHAGDAEKN